MQFAECNLLPGPTIEGGVKSIPYVIGLFPYFRLYTCEHQKTVTVPKQLYSLKNSGVLRSKQLLVQKEVSTALTRPVGQRPYCHPHCPLAYNPLP